MDSRSSIRENWNAATGLPPELVGCHPMGGGGLIGAPYRCYFGALHLRRAVPFDRSMNVLELGCGNGRWIAELAPRVQHYTGVDFNREGLDIAQEVIRRKGLDNVRLVEGSIVEFAGDRPYDVVYFSGVTQYLEDAQIHGVLDRLAPFLTDRTVVVDRSTVNLKARVVHDVPGYYCIYRTPDEIAGIVAAHGFHLAYHRRSYRYLRGGERLARSAAAGPLARLVRALRPASYWVLWAWSWALDRVRPPKAAPEGSHDFLVFRRNAVRD